jgi:hypothetical protein
MSTYYPSIPASSDNPSVSQGQIQTNFGTLNTVFDVDHVTFSAGSNQGMHDKVTFVAPLGANPNQASPIASLYTKTLSAKSQLYFQNDTGSSDVVQLTGSLLTESGNDGQGGTYNYFKTPWGWKVFMGSTTPQSGTRNYTISGSTKFGSTIYTSLATPFGGGAVSFNFTVTNSALGQFQLVTSASIPLKWMVISD